MRLAAFVALLLAQLRAPAPRPAPTPDLVVIGTSEKPYTIAQSCRPDQPAITFSLLAQNIGSAASMAINDPHAVFVQDNANPGWAAGAVLPSLPPGASAKVSVTLLGLKAAGSMSGHHVFTATVNALRAAPEQSYTNNSVTIPIDLPQGFCSPPGATVPTLPSQITAPLPAPTGLTNTITAAVCANFGGPAAALACSIGLPAGKLVLVWSYPSNVPIDGYHVYMTASGSGGVLRNVGSPKPVATQTTPGVRLAMLDPPPAGTCYAVTAFRGANESPHSPTTFCVSQNELAKNLSLKPDRTGTMIASVYVDPTKSATDNIYDNQRTFSNPLTQFYMTADGGMSIGWDHVASLWRDKSRTQVSVYTNSIYRAYLHFDTTQINGRHLARAILNPHVNAKPLCITQYGTAAGGWKHNSVLGLGMTMNASSSPFDVTKIVQSWADSPGSNTGFALQGDEGSDLYHMVIISTTCVTTMQSPTLDVTYY